jgi:hypothetical protein
MIGVFGSKMDEESLYGMQLRLKSHNLLIYQYELEVFDFELA